MRRILVPVLSVTALLLGSALTLPSTAVPPHSKALPELSWRLTPTGTDAGLRGLDAVSRRVAWVSGSEGTVLRTLDGGRTWQDVSPRAAVAEELALRDVEAFDADTAVVLAIGVGEDSRVYRTEDGGRTWRETFRSPEPDAFYDCMSFWNRKRGLAMSDPVDGRFRIARTEDGGRTWSLVPDAGMPSALPGEFGFAASGTCVATAGGRHAWFGTGGGTQARVFRSRDGGMTWQVTATPIRSTEAGGIFSLAFRNPRQGVAVGGDFLVPEGDEDIAAYTRDGGVTWLPARDMPGGYRSGSTWVPHLPHSVIAVGPTGSDVSPDFGRTWTQFDDGSFDAVDCAKDGGCWASGAEGRAAVLVVDRHARRG